MLLLRETRVVITKHEPVATGVVLNEEGRVLAYVKEDGATKVQPSTGVAGEIFAGVNISRNAPPGVLPMVAFGTVNADGTFVLPRLPIAGQLMVKLGADANGAGGAVQTIVAAAPAAGEVEFTGTTTLTLPVATAGQTVFAQFAYTPTVVEAASVVGNIPAAGIPQSDQVGVLKEAQIGTSFFDTSVDWSDAMYVKLAAGGTFTVGTEADHVPNVVVRNAPSSATPFLVVNINIA